MSARALCSLLVAVVVIWAPRVWACPVCFDANGERRTAFMVTTIFLTLTPLVFVLTVVWWLRRRARAFDAVPPAE